MAAIGTVLIYFIYGVLGLVALHGVKRWCKANSSLNKAFAIAQVGFSMGLLLFMVANGYYQHRQAEDAYLGIYRLTTYPECSACVLHLKSDNQYEVRQGDLVIEQGPWYYESGGDYWITHIGGNGGQLGAGKYEYDYNARKNDSQQQE